MYPIKYATKTNAMTMYRFRANFLRRFRYASAAIAIMQIPIKYGIIPFNFKKYRKIKYKMQIIGKISFAKTMEIFSSRFAFFHISDTLIKIP